VYTWAMVGVSVTIQYTDSKRLPGVCDRGRVRHDCPKKFITDTSPTSLSRLQYQLS
jgi:hypothetical protein